MVDVSKLVEIVVDSKSKKYESMKNDKLPKYVIEADGDSEGSFKLRNTENDNVHWVTVVKTSEKGKFLVDSDDAYWSKQGKNKQDYSAAILKVIYEGTVEGNITLPSTKDSQENGGVLGYGNGEQPQQKPAEPEQTRPQQGESEEARMAKDKTEMEELSKELGKMNIETVKRYIAPKECTDTEVKLFCNICAARGANPFLNEAHLVKYTKDEPARTIISKDFFLKKARMAKDYNGFKAGIIVKNSNDEIERREGSFIAPNEELLGGWSHVLLENKEPVKSEVNLEKYMKYRRDGQPTRFWKEIPETMIRKVALSQALREAFPEELGGLYSEEEQRNQS